MPTSFSNRIPLLLLLSLLIALLIYLLWPSELVEKTKHKRIVSVKTVKLERSELKNVIESIGTTRAKEQVEITSKYSDLVDEIFFDDGKVVKKGDVLVRLGDREAQAKVNELKANLSESVAQLKRFKDLYTQKAMSQSLVDQQEAKAKGIEAQLQSAQTKLDYLTITAPFDGVLGFRQISVGSFISAGDIIARLDNISSVKVDFSLPERFLTLVSIGQTINSKSAAYKNKTFVGKVTSIGSRVDSITRTIKVRAEIANKDNLLRSGMLLNINIDQQVDNVLQLPESAIIPIEDKHYVYIAENNKAKRIAIMIGRRKPGIVEVVSGIDEGTDVIVEGALKLRNGSDINIINKAADTTEVSE